MHILYIRKAATSCVGAVGKLAFRCRLSRWSASLVIAGRGQRTFPLRADPLVGEAIDSWLEAIAACHRCTFGDVLHQCGLRDRATDRARWSSDFMTPSSDVVDAIAHATGADTGTVVATTMMQPDGTSASNRHRWGWRRSSRACPRCLAETGGRWPLAWRHNSVFLCFEHSCVMLDTCASCGRSWRTRQHQLRRIPKMNRCANLAPDAAQGTGEMCGADLISQPAVILPPSHPVFRAQHITREFEERRPVTLGLYGASVSPEVVATDLRVLSGWMLRSADLSALDEVLSGMNAGVLAAGGLPQLETDPRRFNVRAGVHPTAIDMAIGSALAVAVLDSEIPGVATELLSQVMAMVRPEWALRLVRGRGRAQLSDDAGTVLVSAFNAVFKNRRI